MNKKNLKKAKEYHKMLNEFLDMKIISLADYYTIKSKILKYFENIDTKTLDKKIKK